MTDLFVYSAAALAVIGCVALFQADARRARFAFIQSSSSIQRGSQVLGSISLAFSLIAFGMARGFELGIPIWLGAVSVIGGAMLVINALRPNWLIPIAIVAIAICMIGFGLSFLIGGGQ